MIWDLVKSIFQGELFSKLGEILSSIWEFIKNLPQNADAWWQEFKQKSPFEQGKSIGNGVGQIAFEVILGLLTGGAVNALKATSVGAKIMAVSGKIHNKIGQFGDGLINASQGAMDKIHGVMPEKLVTPDGQVFIMKRNDMLDNDRPQNMRMDGNKDGIGGNEFDKKENKDISSFLSTKKSKLKERISDGNGFSLRHTDEELIAIIEQGKTLSLSDTEIDDLLYISCRDAKPIPANELIQQMDNWVNVVQKRGYPYKFADLEEFKQFSNDLIKGLNDLGIDSSDVRIQGSSLRTPNAGDVDLAAFISDTDFDNYLINAYKEKVKTKSGEIIKIENKTSKELKELAEEILVTNPSSYTSNAKTFAQGVLNRKISSKTRKPEIISGLRNFRKKLAEIYPNLNIEDISYMTKQGELDIKPFIKL